MAEQERVDAYLDTVRRLEPEIAPIDPSAYYASAAISLKRIADALDKILQEMTYANNVDRNAGR